MGHQVKSIQKYSSHWILNHTVFLVEEIQLQMEWLELENEWAV
jgi:hypothetical protein